MFVFGFLRVFVGGACACVRVMFVAVLVFAGFCVFVLMFVCVRVSVCVCDRVRTRVYVCL